MSAIEIIDSVEKRIFAQRMGLNEFMIAAGVAPSTWWRYKKFHSIRPKTLAKIEGLLDYYERRENAA
jgi:hypothetical protein